MGVTPASAEGLLCEVLAMAGRPEAVREATGIVERLEAGRAAAPPEQHAAYDEAIRRALETLRVVRSYVEPEEEQRPMITPIPPGLRPSCERRWRPR